MKYRNEGLPEDGFAAAETALEHDPDLAEPHCVKAAALARQGRVDEAMKEIAIAEQLDPDSWEVNKEAGYVLYTAGQFEESGRYFETAAAVMETDYRSAGFLAGIYARLGKPEQARAAAAACLERTEAALAQDNANAAALAMGANSLAYLGERNRAKEWARRALIVDPNNLIARYNLACGFASLLGDAETALDLLEDWFTTATASELKHGSRDPDFASIRDHHRFRQMMESAATRVGEPDLFRPAIESASGRKQT